MCSRASGRRKYNALRRDQATFRRNDIALYLSEHVALVGHGFQTSLAQRFGVSKSTISRDMKMIYEQLQPCPMCHRFQNEVYVSDDN